MKMLMVLSGMKKNYENVQTVKRQDFIDYLNGYL